MSQEVEKNLLYSGLLISLGVGGLLGFWWAVICAGVLLFSVALLVLMVGLLAGTVGDRTDRTDRTDSVVAGGRG